MNKTIEEFRVSGKINDEVVQGTVHAYPNNIRHVMPYGLKIAVIESWTQMKGSIMELINNLKIYQKPLIKKAGALLIAGALTITSLTGCNISPHAQENRPPAVAQYVEQKYEYVYTVSAGDNLWNIAGKYCDFDDEIANEVKRICEINKITDKDVINVGQKLKLNIPYSRLEQFGFIVNYKEVSQWDAMDYFVYCSFDIPEDKIHPENHLFWRDKEYTRELLMKALIAREDIEESKKMGIVDPDYYARKEADINEYYKEAVEIAEATTGRRYGTDYIHPPVGTVIQEEKGFTP